MRNEFRLGKPGPGAVLVARETGDNKSMALRAGAEMIKLEFPHHLINF